MIGEPLITRWIRFRNAIEKCGLALIAVAIVALYWIFDEITDGPLTNRILISISILAYGVFTQFLVNAEKSARDSLQRTHDELEQTNEKLATANEKLELAYAWMRDKRDDLEQQLYQEHIGFLINQEGKIEGVTERALVVMKTSRDACLGAALMQLIPKGSQDDFSRELKEAWRGMTHYLKMKFIIPGNTEKEFEIVMTRLTVTSKRMLLVILS